jgi:hypothetical protein
MRIGSRPWQRERHADCLVLYGRPQIATDLESWFEFALGWCNLQKLTPDRIGIDGVGHPSQIVTFSEGQARLRETGFAPVSGLSIYAGNAPGTGTVIDNWMIEFSISLSNSMSYALCDAQSASFTGKRVIVTVIDLLKHFDADYGVFYHRLFRLGPSFYPGGICVGLENNRRERERISKWMHATIAAKEQNISVSRFLREVCPMNFISRYHLDELMVEQRTLREWILESPKHGELSPLAGNMWLWTVNERQIPKIYEHLGRRGLLICYGGYDTRSGGPTGNDYGRK